MRFAGWFKTVAGVSCSIVAGCGTAIPGESFEEFAPSPDTASAAQG